MQVIEIISKYSLYAYIVVGVILLIALVQLIISISRLQRVVEPVSEDIENICADIEALNRKKEIINHTMKVSIPFFLRIYFYLTVVKMALRDYFDTKRSKRNLRKSFNKAYRYQSLIRENKQLRKS